MRISHFFIDRPIFAAVVSIVFVILGGVSFSRLPVAQYPEIAPPIINVSGQYPGASAEVVAATVVTPIEQQINGVENMLYMSSNSTADGKFSIQVSFDLGTNLDIAQVQVQNRVAIAQPRLPADVRNIGVTVTKASPDLMMVVHLYSPDKSRDALFMTNYATLEVTDPLTRVDGVGSVTVFGSRDYSMRIWLDPDRLQSLGLTASDVTAALQGQNIQVASGVLDQPPVAHQGAFQIAVQTLGRLANPEDFGSIVVKETPGAVVRLKDVADVKLQALDYSSNSYLDHDFAIALAVFQRPGSNALSTADGVTDLMAKLSKRFPSGLKYDIVYNPTQFIRQSVDAVIDTIFEAIVLVVLVVILFLQTWRAAIIPLVAIPVSLVGTFFFMAAFGFTLNNLSLFGLVLAIGIVVDDAIVVVENVERNIAAGLAPREAARKSMNEVGSALIAIVLVLCAVFVPSVFITGISGQFYRQFALTIAGATVISLIVSLTLSPAMCALLLKPHDREHRDSWWERPIHGFFGYFNAAFDRVGAGISWLATRTVRRAAMMVVIYLVVLGVGFYRLPQDADRLHPAGRPRLYHRRGAIAAGRVVVAHRRRAAARARYRIWCARHRPRHEYRRLFRRDFHQCTEFRRAVSGAGRFQQAQPRSAAIGAGDPGRAEQAAVRHPGCFHRRSAAAAGDGHRHRRRLPHDGGGPRRPRRGGIARSGFSRDGARQRDDRPVAGVHLVRDFDAAGLSRHRPHQGATPRHQRAGRVQRAADFHRLVLRQRLQSVRPHLPRHRASARRGPPEHRRRAQDPGAQFERRHGAARLVHHGDRHRRAL